MAHREAADVHLVQDRLVPGARVRAPSPREGRVDHAALRHEWGAVANVERHVGGHVPDPVAEERVVPPERAGECLRVWVEQQLVVVEAMPLLGSVRAVDAVPVELAGAHVR